MNEHKPYTIDGEPADAWDLIRRANEYGYCDSGGICFSSEAVAVLRDNGHVIGDIIGDAKLGAGSQP